MSSPPTPQMARIRRSCPAIPAPVGLIGRQGRGRATRYLASQPVVEKLWRKLAEGHRWQA
jgi:hypothetical protein